jgi:ABC-type amino acid transport substrate-binding protein
MGKMMRILRDFILLVLVGVGFVFPVSAAQRSTASPEIQKIIDRGKIIVAMCIHDGYPFYMASKEGRLTGFDVDMAYDIASRLGVRVEFNCKARTFDEVIDIVARREADLGISQLSVTLKRARSVHFTVPYLIVKNYLIVNRAYSGDLRGRSAAELANRKGIKILAERGSAHIDFSTRAFPLAVTVPFTGKEQAIQSVVKKEVFALYHDEIFVKSLFRKSPELYLHLNSIPVEDGRDRFAIAVHWQDIHLLAWLDLYMKTVRPETTVDDILLKYPQ